MSQNLQLSAQDVLENDAVGLLWLVCAELLLLLSLVPLFQLLLVVALLGFLCFVSSLDTDLANLRLPRSSVVAHNLALLLKKLILLKIVSCCAFCLPLGKTPPDSSSITNDGLTCAF